MDEVRWAVVEIECASGVGHTMRDLEVCETHEEAAALREWYEQHDDPWHVYLVRRCST